jgi:hypothetical protein
MLVVLRFTSSGRGELQCRATDPITHESWGVAQAQQIRELIYAARVFQKQAGQDKEERGE